MKVLKHDLVVAHSWYKRATIPKGTAVRPADNLPPGGYWVDVPANASAELASWLNVYGVRVGPGDVAEVKA